ncbi:AlkZ family DNA glycosylase [Dactylosporangium vinaceum]|uniref:Winged helix DNA-binding domain-containing protein n=1 Tax=Dactylosporangium vinaceum TaxID=53362 RepID=A0ABV5M6Y3_9ACTN|nr:winged helix DNA-binding domain-containing protein [Dactylosporangium vinaceum]UAB97874.1 AlkZ family DNA glycosylase [Dactylosporangium vinaceum]
MRITTRTQNRTYLRRQLLLDGGAAAGVADVVRRVVAVQAQDADAPYIGIWARSREFAHDDLTAALEDRSLVRGALLRGTQHIASGADYRWLRPLISARMGATGLSPFRRQLDGIDLTELAAAARDALHGTTMTRPRLAKALGERYPGRESIALAWAAQHQLALIHPPPTGTWRRRGHVHVALADEWLGAALEEPPTIERLLRRYLESCGPASIADFQNWSGLRRLRQEVEALRPQLRTYIDDSGQELFDLPELELADAELDAPVRFLPAFDNLVLSHADRSRIIASPADQAIICPGLSAVLPTFLEDGFVAGTWEVRPGTLELSPFRKLRNPAAVHTEAERLLTFLQLPSATTINL